MSDTIFIVLGDNDRIVTDLSLAFPGARIIPTACLGMIEPIRIGPDTRVIVDPGSVRPCCIKRLLRYGVETGASQGGMARRFLPPSQAAWLERSGLMAPERFGKRTRRFITAALEHDHEWFTVQEAADVLSLSVRQLRRIVEGETGYQPHVLLHLARINSVAGAIAGSTAPLRRIARDHCFSDLPTMCRQFKRFVGTTPGRHRLRARAADGRNRQYRMAETAN